MRRDYSRSYNRRTRTAVRSLITLEVFEQHPHKVIATIGAVFVLAYLLAALAFPRAARTHRQRRRDPVLLVPCGHSPSIGMSILRTSTLNYICPRATMVRRMSG